MNKRTAAELENSSPFDADKRLRGEAGAALLHELRHRIEAWELTTHARERARRPVDANSFALTLDTFLANLAALWLNRVDNTRFLAVGFDANAYAGAPLSLKAMRTLREAMEAEGLIEVARGFLKVDTYEFGKPFARRTRIRAKPSLIEEFDRFGIGYPAIKRVAERGVIAIRNPAKDAGPEPPEVRASAVVLEAVNTRVRNAVVSLPDDAWNRIKAERDRGDDLDAYRAYAGDETAKSLQRIFSERWERGGRMYGGWWMHLPKAERRYILIDGEPVTEWDYGWLHPSLLYQREGLVLEFDPYRVPGFDAPRIRDLGKVTFQRLINRKERTPLRAAKGNKELLPRGVTFASYLAAYTARLHPIAHWFSTGVGMSLQREDSDLAVEVLKRMQARDIVTLPVHDSFIVQERYGEALREEMEGAYWDRYGVQPYLKTWEDEAEPNGGGMTGGTPASMTKTHKPPVRRAHSTT